MRCVGAGLRVYDYEAYKRPFFVCVLIFSAWFCFGKRSVMYSAGRAGRTTHIRQTAAAVFGRVESIVRKRDDG